MKKSFFRCLNSFSHMNRSCRTNCSLNQQRENSNCLLNVTRSNNFFFAAFLRCKNYRTNCRNLSRCSNRLSSMNSCFFAFRRLPTKLFVTQLFYAVSGQLFRCRHHKRCVIQLFLCEHFKASYYALHFVQGIYIIRSRYTKIWKIFKIFSKNDL